MSDDLKFVPPAGLKVLKIPIPSTDGHIVHVECGVDDRWEPSVDEFEVVVALFQEAVDVLCPTEKVSVVVTRRGVKVSVVSGNEIRWCICDAPEGTPRSLAEDCRNCRGGGGYTDAEAASCESEDEVTFEMPPGAIESMEEAEKESLKRLDAELEEARKEGVLDECGHCNAAFELLEPHMRPDEAHVETIARILHEHHAAHTTLGLARDGDTLTALARGYAAYVEKVRRLELLLEESTDCVIMLRGDLAAVAHALFEPVDLPPGTIALNERILGAIEELVRERTEARSLAHELATELGKEQDV